MGYTLPRLFGFGQAVAPPAVPTTASVHAVFTATSSVLKASIHPTIHASGTEVNDEYRSFSSGV
jgi:hypothetical protein